MSGLWRAARPAQVKEKRELLVHIVKRIFGQRENSLLNFCLQGTKCCNYGADGKKIVTASGGYDCILVPGATLAGAIKPNKMCGNNMGIITQAGETSATLCCKFVIDQSSFHSSITHKKRTVSVACLY